MREKIILILGGNKLNRGTLFKFQKKGYLVYIIDWNKKPDLKGDKHYQIDVKDGRKIVDTLKENGEWEKVVFAYSSIDLAVPSITYINRKLGLYTLDDDGVEYTSSKSKMTQRWAEKGLLNRFSKSYFYFDNDIRSLNKKYSLIIKPDNSASSRGITILKKDSSLECIENAFYKAKKEATNETVIVEEFLEGTEFTVEMLGDAWGNVCVYGISIKAHTKNVENNKIAVKLHYNAVEEKMQEKIAKFGIECYKALGVSSSLGHLEVMLKSDGQLSPIEMGARSSGFIASDLVDIVSGGDYLEELMGVQQGNKIQNGLHPQSGMSSVYFFYDFENGFEIEKECSLLDFCDAEIRSRYCDRSNIKIGMVFSDIENDNNRWGYEILEGPQDLLTQENLNDAEKKMLRYMSGDCYDL